MSDYMEYIRCGEILISPSLNCKDQYILKCIECDETFSELETLILHCVMHYDTEIDEKSSVSGLMDDIFEGDGNEMDMDVQENVTIKYEYVSEVEEVDVDNLEQSFSNNEEVMLDEREEDLKEQSVTDNEEEGILQEKDDECNSYSDEVDEDYQEEECLIDYAESDDGEAIQSKHRKKTSSLVRSFMDTKENIIALISAYKKQPYLWNNNLPSKVRANEREGCLQQIISELEEKLNIQITSKQVAAVINQLRHDYREKLKRMDSDENTGANVKKKKSRIWYFEQMNFLKPYVENSSISNLDHLQPQLTTEQIIQILGIYKRFPHLWDTNLIENVCTNKRLEALAQMQKVIESEMGLKTNINTLKRYTYCININFTREKRRNMNNVHSTKDRSVLYKHMLFLLHHVGPFKCPHCRRVFLSPLHLKVHISEHDGSIPFQCSLCDKEYRTTDAYMAHAKRHMNDLKNECEECGKKFSRNADLQIHRRCHTGAKPYFCEICGASYRHSQAFTTHKRRHEKQYLHHCPVCSKGFYKKDQMNNHIRTHTNIRDFICKVCGKGFKTKKTMQQHGFTHEEGRNHSCSICDKTFKNKLGLSQHMKIHRRNEVLNNVY